MTVVDGILVCGSRESCDRPAATGAWLCDQHHASIIRLASGPSHHGRCRHDACPHAAGRHGYCPTHREKRSEKA